ncbi:MmyB family transcriptional regulator [Nocardia seriolae]|uniref:MmyB-like transcription regulator ligand binding domain-containing protein n=1 Tax=Nocardia seriolae TaxID=37332 RepID=A0ABC9Z4V3_9NOCA|nr:hypothetical protein [Nocardia seriolae]APA96601.1 hypothetical protein NS506_02537 [Nocardia seriolae]OJF78940.1 hypothetical protein NS14008_06610 [Nocardia seriolae]WKY51063.1 hypothetical protein Q5P07_29520 [Nocardia seriolae]WNJ57745.1 hypothetical protein RMO66_30815 [Nocardia seriolae]BEK90370.1 hypothetical protein NSERKGN1266_63210 [Nocardia seriolae]
MSRYLIVEWRTGEGICPIPLTGAPLDELRGNGDAAGGHEGGCPPVELVEEVGGGLVEFGRADPHAGALIDELATTVGPEFTRRMDTLPGLPDTNGVGRLTHPEAGTLRLAYETLHLSADDDQFLMVYLPADDATAHALDRLVGPSPRRPARRRRMIRPGAVPPCFALSPAPGRFEHRAS